MFDVQVLMYHEDKHLIKEEVRGETIDNKRQHSQIMKLILTLIIQIQATTRISMIRNE